MGPLNYYRQFAGASEEEVNRGKRERAQQRRQLALAIQEPIDLSQTTWPALPHPYVVNAVTFSARRGLHRYPAHGSAELRAELAHHHELPAERVAIGNGAAQLLGAATQALIEPGQELITPWPSYPLYPLMARRAHGRAVPVAGFSVDAILSAVGERTRIVALANPNDPTGELLDASQLRHLLTSLPEQVAVLLDEALVDFAGPEAAAVSPALLPHHPRLLVFRSFSKAWGLAGLRCGYALGGPGSEQLLTSLEPELGINELAQAGVLESLRSGAALLKRRVETIALERERLHRALHERGLQAPVSASNFLWVAHPRLDGAQLADALGRAGVIVARGGTLGEPARVRIAVRDAATSDRLLRALDAVGDAS